jgi:prepilin-type N-terminal cleavage/methylation domain-containing protein
MYTYPSPRRHGFTLLELAVTLVILGVVALIAVPSFQSLIEKSRTSVSYEIASNFANKAGYIAALRQTAVTGQVLWDSIEFTETGLVITDNAVCAGGAPGNSHTSPNPCATPDDIVGWQILAQNVENGNESAQSWVCIENGKAVPSLTACA